MAESAQFISRKTVASSYRPKNYLMSPGLKRAREPYRLRNALTGLAMAAFATGVWAYSISAVKQDVFDDVDEEARALARSGAMSEMKSIEDRAAETRLQNAGISSANSIPLPTATVEKASTVQVPRRGILVAALDQTFPWLLDPVQKTLVWGAPPVENVGRLSDTSAKRI